MKMFRPITMTDGQLAGTNIAEEPNAAFPAWSGSTSYVTGQQVHVASSHRRYRAVANSTGANPVTDNGTFWLDVGATTRWSLFDGILGTGAERADSLFVEIEPASYATGVYLFGAEGVVRLRQTAAGYDHTETLVDTTGIVDWFDYAAWEPVFVRELVRDDLPGSVGSTVRIDVTATGGTARLRELVLGRVVQLGRATRDASLGLMSWSRVERLADGSVDVTERGYSRRRTFTFYVNRDDEERVERELAPFYARPTVFLTTPEQVRRGTLVYGFVKDFDIPVRNAPVMEATITIEGVI